MYLHMCDRKLISTLMALFLLQVSVAAKGNEAGRQYCSGTLPIMFINSDEPITSKEYYVKATCYIDALGQEG